MKLTSTQIEQARQMLTLEAFAARQLALSRGSLMPLWLCTRPDLQQQLLAHLKASYDAWVTEELDQLVARVEEDPLSNPDVLQASRSPRD
jgi:hypothetical protein